MALAERAIPMPDEREEMISQVSAAREEMLAALETDGDLAAAGKRLK